MITFETMPAAEFNDAELVAHSLKGNREAFRQIVERYQTLISSLGYCATGDVSRSEDLAQETFMTAWKRLASLREPDKLRSWLCGINRFLVSKEFRRLGREPVHAAESLETVENWSSPEPMPPDHVISDEEKAILWRSIERIPETYREPLVLFYREHQSIDAVAQSLDLTPDAVKQRLARGRKLLHEQVLSFVEAALEKTKPDKAFTLGVLAALPLAASTAKAAAAGVVIKGGYSVKAVSSFAMLGAVLTASVLFMFSLIGFFIFTGACVGYMMSRACRRSARDYGHVIMFWRLLALDFLGIVAPAFLASAVLTRPAWHHDYFPWVTLWLRLVYPVALAALLIWIVRWWHGLRHPDAGNQSFEQVLTKRLALWLALGMLLPAIFCGEFVYAVLFQQSWTTQSLPVAQAQSLITGRRDADVTLEEHSDGTKTLWIRLPENRRTVAFFTSPDAATLALLTQSGIHFQTSRDLGDVGLSWHGLIFLSIFVASMGGVLLASRPWQQRSFVWLDQEVRRDERAAKHVFKSFAVSVAIVMLVAGVMLGLITRWNVHRVAPSAVPKIVADLKFGEYEVFQFNNGSKELWICQHAHQGHPDFIAPADAATLALLTDRGITYKTYVQGRDFGFGAPNPWLSFFGIFLLVGGGGIILWGVSPRVVAVLAALVLGSACLLLVLVTPWRTSPISASEARVMISLHPTDRFEVFEYNNGSRELSIMPHGRRHCYLAPADATTLALLAERKIEFKTSVQGRDFGIGRPTRGMSFLWISGLAAVAGSILWFAWRKKSSPETAGDLKQA